MKTTILLLLICGTSYCQQCQITHTGLKPITDTTVIGGGLYAGTNTIPAAHGQAGTTISATIKPLNCAGQVDSINGKIVFASIGMSNAEQIFAMFQDSVAASPHNQYLQTVNAAIQGMEITRMLDTTNRFWDSVDARLIRSGVTRKQVQVVWFLEAAHLSTIQTAEGISHIDSMANRFERAFRLLKIMFPNLKMLYCSGREYGGYCNPGIGNPEPWANYTNAAFKQVVLRQISGAAGLRFGGRSPVCPWLCWAGNFWTDGTAGRPDGLKWLCSDVQSDGVHPSAAGEAKAAHIMVEFFRGDASAGWFRY